MIQERIMKYLALCLIIESSNYDELEGEYDIDKMLKDISDLKQEILQEYAKHN